MPILSSFGGLSAIGRGQRAGGRKRIEFSLPSSQNNYLLDTSKVASLDYEPGNSDIIFIIPSGMTIGSGSTGTPSFKVDASWGVNDSITIVNNGNIYGRGGAAGASGGAAVQVQRAVAFTNNGNVYSGGGGGGTGGPAYSVGYNPLDPETACYGGCGTRVFAGGAGGQGQGSQGGPSGGVTGQSNAECCSSQGGTGGTGGGFGSTGNQGGQGTSTCCGSNSGYGGGQAGACTLTGSKVLINAGSGISGSTLGLQN